jgi:hypothetical protein
MALPLIGGGEMSVVDDTSPSLGRDIITEFTGAGSCIKENAVFVYLLI